MTFILHYFLFEEKWKFQRIEPPKHFEMNIWEFRHNLILRTTKLFEDG